MTIEGLRNYLNYRKKRIALTYRLEISFKVSVDRSPNV